MSSCSAFLFADSASRTYYELVRLTSMTEWWHWMLLTLVVVAVLVFAAVAYYFDSRDLPRGTGWLLFLLRALAFVGVLIFFLDLQKRTERRVLKNSRVAVLVDTSQSMGLPAADASESKIARRIDGVIDQFSSGSLLTELQAKHDVSVYQFDQTSSPRRIASFSKKEINTESEADDVPLLQRAVTEARRLWSLATGLVVLAMLTVMSHFMLGRRVSNTEGQSWALLVTVLALIVATVVAAIANLRNPQIGPMVALGMRQLNAESPPAETTPSETETEAQSDDEPTPNNTGWAELLVPGGLETRLGDAIRSIVEQERGGPIAGIAVFTDGENNGGIEPSAATALAKQASIPLFPIGLGSDTRPRHVRLADIEVPARVYPGDSFEIAAFVQAHGMSGRSTEVELLSRVDDGDSGEASSNEPFISEAKQTVTLGDDGELSIVKFVQTPDEGGRRIYQVRVDGRNLDSNDLDSRHRQKQARVEVVNRKNRVLLIAGGPTREYRFLRNQLFRDRETTVDVLLQSGRPGLSQDADDLLFEFPIEADELFEYDCIVAFDPDWRKLDQQQIELVDRWIAEKSGGLIAVAGPVYTSAWTRSDRADGRLDTVRSWYPVTFYSRGAATIQLGRFGAEDAWPLRFSDEGLKAAFLRLDNGEDVAAWDEFPGVFSYHAVKDVKPGAKVYAYFSDPDTAIDGRLPPYIAGHFYGAGRVLYLGSGEMWRLRSIDDGYFETVYTKLIRFVSQGRLLRDSSRGVLLSEKDRCLLGENIVLRASLTDAQFNPLSVPNVDGFLVTPDGERQPITFKNLPQEAREGMYAFQFLALKEGDYRVELPVPNGDELLTREIRVRIPDREIQRPQRNDALLSEIADNTGGFYYVGTDAALGADGTPSLASRLLAKDQETYLPGTPDREFERRLMGWLLALISGVLCLEWLVRRLNKLA